MTLTDPTFDAFEQRLAAVLDAEASTVVEPADGLERIHARIAHRRRVRRTTWAAAAAVVVLLTGIVGVALRPTTTDSAPFVETGTDPTGGMPLLGFANEQWTVVSYTPGGGYGVVFGEFGELAQPVLQVHRDGSGYPGSGVQIDITSRELIGGREVEVGTLTSRSGNETTYQSPVLQWVPAPGYTATVMNNSSLQAGLADDLRAAAAAVIDVDLGAWEDHLRAEATRPRPSEAPMLVLAPSIGTTELVNVSGDSILAWLTPEDRDGGVMLGALAEGVEFGPASDPSIPVIVRGAPGRYLEGPAPGPMLVWEEGGRTYYLMNVQMDEGISLAEALVLPDARQWSRLLFPSEPSSLPDDLIPSGP